VVGGIRYELLDDVDVPEATLALAGALLCDAFGPSRARRRGWTLLRPLYRVLVWDGDVLVGNEAGCLVGCDPPILLHGIADAAVRDGWRSAGIARAMGAMIHQEAIRRGAAAVICDTGTLGRAALEHGMRAVEPGELYLRRRFRRDLPLVANWYVRWHGKRVAPLAILARV
jgi:GNAT superfamily N-acetyltransferase